MRNGTPKRSTQPLRLAVAAALVAALAGCGIVPKKEPLSIYAPDVRVQADPAWPTVRWQLQIPRPHAPEMLDSPRIVVRPSPGEMQVYQGAIWSGPVPDLVQDTVVQAFEDSGRIAGVARRGSGVAGDYELLIDLRRFDSDYNGGGAPSAEVELAVKLIANRTNQVVATRTLKQSVPAASTAVGDVSRAFGTALSSAVQDLVGWTLAQGQQYDAAHPAPTAAR